MTGPQFRMIRQWNDISQMVLAKEIGWKSRMSVWRLEQRADIPDKYVANLSKLLKMNLLHEPTAMKAYVRAHDAFQAELDRRPKPLPQMVFRDR
jgi:hypothetical protein